MTFYIGNTAVANIYKGSESANVYKGSDLVSLPLWFPLNRRVIFIGDSITDGSLASNSIYAYPTQSLHHAGCLHHPISLMMEKGNPGETSTAMLARFQTDVMANSPSVIVIMAGANDANMVNAIPVETYGANITGMIALSQGKPVVVVTPTPRASGATDVATINGRIVQYRQWIIDNATVLGYKVADAYTAVSTGGFIDANKVDVDNLHPNDLGHQKIARVVGAQIKASQMARTSLVGALSANNLLSNGLFTGTIGQAPAGWNDGTPTSTGTTSTRVIITSPNDAFTSTGQGYRVSCAALATTSIRRTNGTTNTGFTTGDKLLFVGKLRANPGALDWDDVTVSTKNARTAPQISNGGNGVDLFAITRTGAIDQDFGYTYTVAGGVTSVCHMVRLDLVNGQTASVDAFEWGVFNLTALGLATRILN